MAGRRSAPTQPQYRYIAEAVPGLSNFVEQELQQKFSGTLRVIRRTDSEIEFAASYHLGLDKLRTAQAVYSVERFDIPRPKAFLGDQHYRRLIAQLGTVLKQHPHETYNTLHIGAAGSDSAVMNRLKETLSQNLKLHVDDSAGDLLLRIRRTADVGGWETLVRLMPRPLASRYWRICDMPGALNGTVAHVMSLLAAPSGGLLCNLASGSASIMIEHNLRNPGNRAVGIDFDSEVLDCGSQNIEASRVASRSSLILGEVAHVPAGDGVFDALCADLPFGQRVGSHADNVKLYPVIFREAGRIASSGALFVVLSHEVRLMGTLLAQEKHWTQEAELPITLRGLHPRIYVLRRR